jgi:hypothetical protein
MGEKKQYLSIETLPASFLLPYAEKSFNMIPDTEEFVLVKSRIIQVRDFIANTNSKGDLEKLKNLKIFLDEISRRRKTNWREYYPWLESFFNE